MPETTDTSLLNEVEKRAFVTLSEMASRPELELKLPKIKFHDYRPAGTYICEINWAYLDGDNNEPDCPCDWQRITQEDVDRLLDIRERLFEPRLALAKAGWSLSKTLDPKDLWPASALAFVNQSTREREYLLTYFRTEEDRNRFVSANAEPAQGRDGWTGDFPGGRKQKVWAGLSLWVPPARYSGEPHILRVV